MFSHSNKEQVISSLAGRGHSHGGLILALFSILLLMAGGFAYLLVNFHNVATTSATAVSASEERYSLLLSSYQQAVDTYYLADRAYSHPAERQSLKKEFLQKSQDLRNTKERYLSLLESPGGSRTELATNSAKFFGRVDSLLDRISNLFDAKAPSSQKLAISGKAQGLFTSGVSDYFRRLRKDLQELTNLEMASNADIILQARDLTREAALKWFVVSGFLFVFAVLLVVVVIRMERQATSLVQQFKTILDHYVNPLAVTNRSGKILYVNAELEKWSGTSREDLLGSNIYEGMTAHGSQAGQPLPWADIFKLLDSGRTWSGEVDVHHRPGYVSTSMLVVLPITGKDGTIQEVVNILHDTAERKTLARQVEEARIQYQRLVENSLDGIVVVQDNKLVFVNPAAVRIFRYDSRDEMEKLSFVDTVAPASRPFLVIDYVSRPLGEEILKNYEMKGLTKDSKLIDLAINARVIVWNERPALHATYRDISERKALERQQAIWLWEQETLSSIDRQLLGILDLQKVLDIILQQVILMTRAQFAGIALFEPETQLAHWRATRGNRTQVVGEFFRVTPALSGFLGRKEYVTVEDGGGAAPISISDIPPLEAEKIVSAGFFPLTVNHELRGRLVVGFRQSHRFSEREIRVLGSMAEKTSIALTSGELYEDLLHREKELELLSGARIQAQEEERRRISREIHDGLGQLLTAIKFNLEIFEDALPEHEETDKRMTDLKQLLDNVMKEAREISYNLMPSVLDDFGLAPGLLSLCEQFSKGTGLKATFHEHGLKERLSPDIEIGLYRIVQEALNNVAKHANAKEVEVQIVRHSDLLRLTVEDDGKGMVVLPPLKRSLEHGGTGLVSMRERAGFLKGTLVIDSTPEKGTTINVEIPLVPR